MHTSTKRYRVPMIALCFLAVAHVTPSQADPDPNVVFSMKEWAHWAPVVGADAPAFTVYDSKEVIYYDREADHYNCAQLTEGQYTRLLEKIVPKDLAVLDDYYMRVWETCQNVYYFYFGGESPLMVTVYGHPTVDFGGAEWTYEIPHSLRRCFDTIQRYQNSRAVRWLPEQLEVIVWDMFPTDEQYTPWPPDWPDLDSPDTIKRAEVYSVFLPNELYDEFMALLEESRGIVMMNGRPMVVWFRMPIPGEEVFAQPPDEPRDEGTALHVAARRDDLETVTRLLDEGADVNATDSYGRTPLHKAASEGRLEIAELLLTRGADVDAQTLGGTTPLHTSIPWGDEDMVELLLAAGARTDTQDVTGRTALHIAAEWGYEGIAQLLAAHDADIEAKTVYGNTPLLCALDFREPNVATVLLGTGADVSVRNDANDTGLHYTTYDTLTDAAEQLIAGGLDVNVRNDVNDTPLYSAVRDGALAIVELLLAHGADLEAAKPDGRTALHAAAQEGHAGIVELLIAHGADVDARTREGDTPLDYAVHAARHDVEELIRAARTDADEGTSVTSPGPF